MNILKEAYRIASDRARDIEIESPRYGGNGGMAVDLWRLIFAALHFVLLLL